MVVSGLPSEEEAVVEEGATEVVVEVDIQGTLDCVTGCLCPLNPIVCACHSRSCVQLLFVRL